MWPVTHVPLCPSLHTVPPCCRRHLMRSLKGLCFSQFIAQAIQAQCLQTRFMLMEYQICRDYVYPILVYVRAVLNLNTSHPALRAGGAAAAHLWRGRQLGCSSGPGLSSLAAVKSQASMQCRYHPTINTSMAMVAVCRGCRSPPHSRCQGVLQPGSMNRLRLP